MLEIFRAIIPSQFILDDNFGNHYRVMQNKMKYLSKTTRNLIGGDITGPGEFKVPPIEKIKEITSCEPFCVRFEIWKWINKEFDVQNYTKSFKASVDVFSNMGYWTDDNWKIFYPLILAGGSREVWKERAFRYPGDGLPCELTLDWWKANGGENYDTMLRIMIGE